jgi:hypothetical protein
VTRRKHHGRGELLLTELGLRTATALVREEIADTSDRFTEMLDRRIDSWRARRGGVR